MYEIRGYGHTGEQHIGMRIWGDKTGRSNPPKENKQTNKQTKTKNKKQKTNRAGLFRPGPNIFSTSQVVHSSQRAGTNGCYIMHVQSLTSALHTSLTAHLYKIFDCISRHGDCMTTGDARMWRYGAIKIRGDDFTGRWGCGDAGIRGYANTRIRGYRDRDMSTCCGNG